jgi:hypothetical protein
LKKPTKKRADVGPEFKPTLPQKEKKETQVRPTSVIIETFLDVFPTLRVLVAPTLQMKKLRLSDSEVLSREQAWGPYQQLTFCLVLLCFMTALQTHSQVLGLQVCTTPVVSKPGFLLLEFGT